jgi:IclR family acetate operon transcriptional repressor
MAGERRHGRRATHDHEDDEADRAVTNGKVDVAEAPDPASATPEQDHKYNQRSVERVVSVLNVLQEYVDGISLVELSRAVNLPKASAFRYLWTLEKHKYVERDRTGHYRLGIGFIGMQSRDIKVLQERARPWLEKLRDLTSETANLGVLVGDHVIYLDIVESQRGVRMARSNGDRDPLYCTALGKAIAAQLPEDQVREILGHAELTQHTTNTITNVDDYLSELGKVRRRGYAVDDGENDVDGRCVAAPILGSRAAISISAPATRFPVKKLEKVAGELIEIAGRLGGGSL